MIIAALAAGLMGIAAPALADVGGTSETDNDVSCGASPAAVPGGATQVNVDGDADGGALVVCNDDDPDGPVNVIQGRIIVSGTQSGAESSGYIAVDGDKDNPPEALGWVRVNLGAEDPGVKCGGPLAPGTSTDAETDNGTQNTCPVFRLT